MKSLLLSLSVLLSIGLNAQITKGQISYDVDYSSDSPEAAQYMERLQNSSLDIYFTDGILASNSVMGEFMTLKSVSVQSLDSTFIFMDGMMGKIAMRLSNKENQDDRNSQSLVADDAKVELIDETKKIAGYDCKKAIITQKDGETSEVWYTTAILPSYRGGTYFSDKIPGATMAITAKMNGMDVKISAYSVKTKFKKEEEIFSTATPKGYKVMTPEDMKKMRGGR
ncbi:MAG: GLPGLI family protein [Brumimicrobium sp.]|nr:GLPGLI family protein [Brumimicrobium sp.]MCO5267566.1 GLPGLI family protein [Brumimicrobium sp.]